MIMKNYLLIYAAMMLCSAMIFAQPSQKLTGLTVISSNPQSNPMKLVNEQADLPNSPAIPTSIPTDGWNTWFADNAELDLGGTFTVTDIYLFDAYGNPPFGIDYLDTGGNWQVLNDLTLNAYLQWVPALSNGNISTSRLRFRKTDQSTSVFEVAIYGSGGVCLPVDTPCDDGNPNTENDKEDGNCNCVGTPISPSGCLTNKDAGGNPANIAALDAAYNNPSPYSFRHMMGINDAGQFQGIANHEVNPISYLTPNMRAFHAMDFDFNANPGCCDTPYESLTKPKDTDGFPDYIDDVTSYTNFTHDDSRWYSTIISKLHRIFH